MKNCYCTTTSHDLVQNNELDFSSNELAFLPQIIFKYQTAETTKFQIDLEASVNYQNLQWYKFSDEGFSARRLFVSCQVMTNP